MESKAATSTPTKADGAQSAKDAGGAESTKDTGGRAHETHETRDHDQRHDEGKEPASGSSNGDKEGGPSSSKPEHSDEKSAATEDAGKGKGTGKGKGKGFPDAFHKGKGKGKAMHRHGRSHSRGRRGQHHHHHNKHHQHHQHHHRHHRHHGHSPPRSLSQRRRLKRLLQRARQLRSHSPRARSAPWSDDEGAVRRLTQAGGSPTRRIASLQRKVGLLQVDGASAPGASSRRHLAAPVKSSALSLDPALAAPMPVASRPARAKVTAFLFNIGEDAEEADKIDQEGDQAEIQEEAKSIVNAESAGYETPTGVEEGEIEEFDHEMEGQAADDHGADLIDEGPRAPGCPCPAWDPMKTALPEDLQHASLAMLQRRIRPENRVAPSLREASASVERAGRLFEGWVRRRQQLAEVLPELSVKMEHCRNRAKDFADSAAENALSALKARVDEGAEAEEEAEQEEEMAEGQEAFEAIGEAQSDFNQWAQEEDAHQHPNPSYLDQASFLSRSPPKAAASPASAFQAFPPGQNPQQLAQAMGQIWGKGGGAGPVHGPPMTPEAEKIQEAEEPNPTQLEAQEAQEEEEEVLQAEEVENFGDFFRECGEFRIPATVLAARRAANEAYWAFDRAMQDAEKKVGLAIQHSVLHGA